jgi:hypothetical protein
MDRRSSLSPDTATNPAYLDAVPGRPSPYGWICPASTKEQSMDIRSKPLSAWTRAVIFVALSVSGVAVFAEDSPTAADPIAAARKSVAANADDGNAHLQLAQALGTAMQKDPALGMQYAGDMLNSLKKAIELDPSLTEAYEWLAGYYLNAPPIAGGSVVEAEKVARQLLEIDADRGHALLGMIEQRKASGGGGQH